MINDEEFIVISAHHCAPNMGSEHAVGWNFISKLANYYNLIIITENNEFREPITQAIKDIENNGKKIFIYFVDHGMVSDGRKNNLRFGYYLTYIKYQFKVFKLVKEITKSYNVKLIHHLTIVGFREPGFLWLLNIPFIWGPVGGLVYSPKVLFHDLTTKMKFFQVIRNSITWLQFNFSPRVRLAYYKTQKKGCFIAAEPSIGDRFVKKFGGNYEWIPETGANIFNENQFNIERSDGLLHVLWVGALIDIKPLQIVIDSICKAKNTKKIKLTVVGDGDARSRYEKYALTKNINAKFVGWVDHNLVDDYFKSADLFCLLSMKDLTTNVVFESLSHSLPVLCLNHHGYSYIVDDKCGFKVDLDTRDNIIFNISTILDQCVENPSIINSLRAGALSKGIEFSWDKNISKVLNIYERF